MSQIYCSEGEGCGLTPHGEHREGGAGAPLQTKQGWLRRASQQPTSHKTAAGFAGAFHLSPARQPPAQGDSARFLYPQPELQASTAPRLNLPHAGSNKTSQPGRLSRLGPAGDRPGSRSCRLSPGSVPAPVPPPRRLPCSSLGGWVCLAVGTHVLALAASAVGSCCPRHPGAHQSPEIATGPCSLVWLFRRRPSPKNLLTLPV